MTMRAPVVIALGLLAAAAVGCGGSGDASDRPSASFQSGGGAPPSDPCEADDGLAFLTIENFEDGRAQQWWISGDGTPDAFMDPPADTQSLEATELDEPRCGETTSALRIRAEGLKVYGGAFGISFLADYPEGRDLRDWEGLSLWVKRNPEAPGQSLFVAVNDPYTDTTTLCNDDSLTESKKCDRFGSGVPLPEQWRFLKLPFDKMKQRGFGVIVEALAVEYLTGINISFEAGDWDFYVDDVAFYRPAETEQP